MPNHHVNQENQISTRSTEGADTHRNNVSGVTEILHKCGITKRQTTSDRRNVSGLNRSCSLSQHTLGSENGSVLEQIIQDEKDEERVSACQTEGQMNNAVVEMSSIEATLDNFWIEIKNCALAEIKELLQKMNQQLQKEINTVKKKYELEFKKCLSEQEQLQKLLRERESDDRRKDAMVEHLLEILKQNQDKATLKDAMIRWHKNSLKQKFQNMQNKIARSHYENRIKQKAFNTWCKFLKGNWITTKQKYEAQDNDQKAIIQQQHQKLQELTAELESTKKKLNSLKGKTNEQQEIMRRSLLRGVCALNMETMNLLSSSDLMKYLSSKNSLDPVVNKNTSAELNSGNSASNILDVCQANNSFEDVQKDVKQVSEKVNVGSRQNGEKNAKTSVQKETLASNLHNTKRVRVHNYYCERLHK